MHKTNNLAADDRNGANIPRFFEGGISAIDGAVFENEKRSRIMTKM